MKFMLLLSTFTVLLLSGCGGNNCQTGTSGAYQNSSYNNTAYANNSSSSQCSYSQQTGYNQYGTQQAPSNYYGGSSYQPQF